MKKTIWITLLFAAAGFAQEPVCDCADCREKAAAAVKGKSFTLPGLEGLNKAEVCEGEHDHEQHVEPALRSVHTEPASCEHDHDAHAGHDHGTEAPDAHAGHDHGTEAPDAHAGHDHCEPAEAGVELSEELVAKVGLSVVKAQSGTVVRSSVFPAEIKLNRDRMAAVSPRYPSLVRQVFAEMGDAVKKGDVLASLENRQTMAVYTVSAPLDGVVIRKDLAAGESVGEESVLYEVADLSSVWAEISIFPKYQHLIRKGMEVEFVAHDGHRASGAIQYISPMMSPETRTFTARCVLEGAGVDFPPGAFVRARIFIEKVDAEVVVPREAVQMLEGFPVVFVPGEHGFQPLEIRTGLSDDRQVQVLSGLMPGDEYVAEGAFVLKAQMVTAGMDPHAGHGH